MVQLPEKHAKDPIIQIQGSSESSLLFLVTKQGNMYIIDAWNGVVVHQCKITDNCVFATAPDLSSPNTFVGVTNRGQVLRVKIGTDLISVLQNQPDQHIQSLADELASRMSIEAQEPAVAVPTFASQQAGDEESEIEEQLKAINLQSDQETLVQVLMSCAAAGKLDKFTRTAYYTQNLPFLESFLVEGDNPGAVPTVLGALFDCDADEPSIKHLLDAVGGKCPTVEVIETANKRNQLRLLLPWLEERSKADTTEEIHTTLAKIYIDFNHDPDTFLEENQFYNGAEIGRYLEDRGDPQLAFIAYKKDNVDEKVLEFTSRHHMLAKQVKYLLQRQDAELWGKVLDSYEDPYEEQRFFDEITEQIENCEAEEISVVIRAFMNASKEMGMIQVLEKVVLGGSSFASNTSLQNLLLLTLIKGTTPANKDKVMRTLQRLDNYAVDLGPIALQYDLPEEAIFVFEKHEDYCSAVNVMLDDMHSLPKATTYAEKVNRADVWSAVGKAQLEESHLEDAIDCYMNAEDATVMSVLISAARAHGNCYPALVKYLKLIKETCAGEQQRVDTELIWIYLVTGATEALKTHLDSQQTLSPEVLKAIYQKGQEDGQVSAGSETAALLSEYVG
eukprot:TRINITY_DN48222_c0_g1_i1.p1 TRINITY_DN48222_c0_g1~~TRINITY_DN48222_c0_g1_i1.p1  ORF type:complete len:641 (+),score=57.46 TRINITY_DN48222_c0_g1_i1:74-1924(+)